MYTREQLEKIFSLDYSSDTNRRIIAGKEIILHCHHYNSRIQRSVEKIPKIDGKSLIKGAAEVVFAEQFEHIKANANSEAQQWELASGMYQHLGFGKLDFSKVNEGVIRSQESHFVKGWQAGFAKERDHVCTFTEGYIQGIVYSITGKLVNVQENQCMISGADKCLFSIDTSRTKPFLSYKRSQLPFQPNNNLKFDKRDHIDESAIIDAVVGLPIFGNEQGLIPAFGVFLGNMPADFYNFLVISFVEEMSQVNMLATAQNLLVSDGEFCGLNTFHGIMNSQEWEALVKPMIKENSDNLYAVIAVSNALGWGNWKVAQHQEGEFAEIVSLNGYEALGYKALKQHSEIPQCYMLRGVSAGIMELIYGFGPLEDRYGSFESEENTCIASGSSHCTFSINRAQEDD